MKPITQFALELATEYHKGQKRRDGKDYITHPIAVAELVKQNYSLDKNSLFYDMTVCAAYLHDSEEDCNITAREIVSKFLEVGYYSIEDTREVIFRNTLESLNKNNFATYTEYIKNIASTQLAREVKIADQTHNLSDLKPGSLRDKYELALYILTK